MAPSPEVCDGLDNDCNGSADDGNPQELGSPPPAHAATLVDASTPQTLGAGESAWIWADFRNDGAEAQAACAARGGALVTVSNAEENAFLVAIGASDAWLGYTDAAVEGTFVWASGQSSYTSWGMAQPDDAGGNEDCAVVLADGTWNDAPCDGKRAYLCEDLRARAPDPGDACDACPTAYEPGSMPVMIDGGTCGGAGGGAPDGGAP